MEFKGISIISVNQFDREGLDRVISLSAKMEKFARGEKPCRILSGRILANLFFEASTRSRLSFDTAFARLGGTVNSTIGVTFSSISKGETLADTVKVVDSYCDVIAIRHPEIGSAAEAANHSRVPVINAGDGPGEHPTQALLDLFTIFREKKRIDGLTIALSGDLRFGRTVHSLARLLALYDDIRLLFVAPELIQMPKTLVEHAESNGCEVVQTADFHEAIAEADIIYSTRIQKERFLNQEEFEAVNGIFVLTRGKVEAVCKPDVTIMHPLPRTNEIHIDVDDLPNAAYFRQAENGVMTRMALFTMIFGKEAELLEA